MKGANALVRPRKYTVPRFKIAAVERRKACALAMKRALLRANAQRRFVNSAFRRSAPSGGSAAWGI